MTRLVSSIRGLLGLIVFLSSSRACYYQALNLENPADYYYRYCYAGCTDIKADQAPYTACCTPLPAGTAAPVTCAELSKSHEKAGTTCQWGQVPTTDFPQTYNYAPTSSGIAAQSAVMETVWVTSTTVVPCPSQPPAPVSSSSQAPPPPAPPSSSKYGAKESTSSGMLALSTTSNQPPPSPPPASSPYVHVPPPSSPPAPPSPPPPSSKVAPPVSSYYHPPASSPSAPPSRPPSSPPLPPPSSPPPPPLSSQLSSTTIYTAPCVSSVPGLVYGSYEVSCTGSKCNHVGNAPSGSIGNSWDKRNENLNLCPHVGNAPASSVKLDNYRRDLPSRTITPAPYRRDHEPVVGLEGARRALTDDLDHLKDMNVKRQQGAVTSTTTAKELFYNCGGTWILGTPSAAIGQPSSSLGSPLIRSYSSGAGNAPSSQQSGQLQKRITSQVTVWQTYWNTASCPYPGGQIPGRSSSVGPAVPSVSGSYMPGPFPSGTTCFCSPDYVAPASVPSTPPMSSARLLSGNYSSGAGAAAPSGYNASNAWKRDGVEKRNSANLKSCDCACGKVVSTSAAVPSSTILYGASISSGAGSAPSSVIPAIYQRDERGSSGLPAGFEQADGGIMKRALPPDGWEPSHPNKREESSRKRYDIKREAPPKPVTSTTWVTSTADCQPSQVPEEEEDCDEDYSLEYGQSTSSGMLAQATSSVVSSNLYSHARPSSSAPYVGDGQIPDGFVTDDPQRRAVPTGTL